MMLEYPFDLSPYLLIRDMAEVPSQKKIAFLDSGSGDMYGVYASLIGYCAGYYQEPCD